MRFFVLTAALFLTVYTVYASPVGPVPPKPGKAIVDTFAPFEDFAPRDLVCSYLHRYVPSYTNCCTLQIPRMDSEGQSSHEPDLNAPDRYLLAYTSEDIESVAQVLAKEEATDKELIHEIITKSTEGTPDLSKWSITSLPTQFRRPSTEFLAILRRLETLAAIPCAGLASSSGISPG